MHSIRSALFVILLTVAVCGRAEIEFSAYLVSQSGTRFILTNLETGKHSTWLAREDSFEGFVVKAFDAAREVLTIDRSGNIQRLSLKASRIKDGASTSRDKLALQFSINADGVVVIDGHPTEFDRVQKFVRDLVHADIPVVLAIHSVGTKKTLETLKRVTMTLKAEGATKWEVHLELPK